MSTDGAFAVSPPPWTLRGDATAILFPRGMLAFVRYTESNVGPYDELLWLAPFQRSAAGRAHHVPVIFVSSQVSASSGRANWGLPKEVAEFRVSAGERGSGLIEVTRYGQSIASFVRHRPSTALPFGTRAIPRWARRLVQTVGGRCFETVPEARGRWGLTSVSQLQVNPELLPDARSSRQRRALSVGHFELVFPAAQITEGPGGRAPGDR